MTAILKLLLGGVGVAVLLTLLSPVSLAVEQTSEGEVEQSRVPYYLLRPDLRHCGSPLCGGYWIEAVNQKLSHCADGERRETCYVADVDWQAIGLDGTEGSTLVQGRQHMKEFPGFGSVSVLLPEAAYRPATSVEARGRWYGLGHNGVVCVTHPCFDIDERVLNRSDEEVISAVDLNGVGANPDDMEAAHRSLFQGELIAVGQNVIDPDQGPAGAGITLVASLFFLRIHSEAE